MALVEKDARELAAGQWLNLEVESVAGGMLTADTARAVGEALRRHPPLDPGKLGPNDPPRTAVTDPAAQLEEWASAAQGSRVAQLNLARAEHPHLQGGLMLHRDHLTRGKRLISKVDLGYEAEWFVPDPSRLDTLVDLMVDLVEVTRAFHATIGFSLLSWQLRQLWSRAHRDKGFTLSPYADHPKIERHLEDVYWVQYFGPAFLDKWGRERFSDLGVRREEGPGGGLVVWATEHPWHYQHEAASLRDYPWKVPFFDKLGEHAIWHEDLVEQAPGDCLPRLEEHAGRA